jgi:hypothetical protein
VLPDGTILDASSSTKNKQKGHDREMHQTKKGNQWYFGMKPHIGPTSSPALYTGPVDKNHPLLAHALERLTGMNHRVTKVVADLVLRQPQIERRPRNLVALPSPFEDADDHPGKAATRIEAA